MQTVNQIAAEIVAREGGYVNDPDDPGGATKYGVTLGTMRRLWLDLTGDGRIDTADVRALTQEQARDIFVREYFERPRIGLLPEALQPAVFDMQVNAGSNAVRVLQRLLNDLLDGDPLVVDGALGPQTARAAYQAVQRFGDCGLRNAYGDARREYYYGLGDARPASRKYARTQAGGKGGWITRAEAFMDGTAHLSDAQHRARVAGWG